MTLLGYVDSMRCHYTYVNDRVGKCNRLDMCGYHYTPHQYFEDNPWLRNDLLRVAKYREMQQRNTQQHETTPPSEARDYLIASNVIARRTHYKHTNYATTT